jgi:tRNA (guanine-N7-)-methyltransferase
MADLIKKGEEREVGAHPVARDVKTETSFSFSPPALHGRRRGKKLTAYHTHLIEASLPRLALTLDEKITNVPRLFAHRPQDIWLEIGFGGGEHLVGLAKQNPQAGFIGCEAFHNGVAKALALIADQSSHNIRLFEGDAGFVINALPDACLQTVCLLYPDPWPKRRQHKRRFLSDSMLTRLARVIKPGGELRFATDIDHNAGWTLARVLRSPDFCWNARNPKDWQTPWEGWEGTRYEAKALQEGRKPAYFVFQRRGTR